MDVFAQISSIWAPPLVDTNSNVNIFADWVGQYPLQSLNVEVEGTSVLEAAAFTCLDGPASIHFDGQLYKISPVREIHGNCQVMLTIRGGSESGVSTIKLSPRLPDNRRWKNVELDHLAQRLDVKSVHIDAENKVGSFGEAFKKPLRIDTSNPVDVRQSFTLELWVRTTSVDRVLVSSWDGRESTPYPIELVIEPAGRLVFYTGQQGLHESMSSLRPIADGTWHHVAVTNDSERNVVTLSVDGSGVDSLRLAQPASRRSGFVFLGGRPGSGSGNESEIFRGEVDGLRIWSIPRTRSELDQARYRSGIESSSVIAALEFDGDMPEAGILVSKSTLAFTPAIEDVAVSTDERNVILGWSSSVEGVREFVVEESGDGRQFEEIGIVPAGRDAGEHTFSFTSYDVQGGVAYYRIRQVFEDNSSRSSHVVKVGLGESLLVPEIHFSNFPNPFSTTTRISYELTEQSQVSLSVWDIAGQSVARLVDEVLPTGIHEAEFDASELPSGIYFVRLEVGEMVLSRKVTVAR